MPNRVLTLASVLCVAAALVQRLPAQQTAQPPGPDTVRYTPARGAVTFTHAKHATLSECSACHHESRRERPYDRPRQACGDCHLAQPTGPVKTSRRDAFHDTSARRGVCYDCHEKDAAAGKAVPTACNDCHKRQAG